MKELKKLKKIVADTKRELEHKDGEFEHQKREPEQLRSSLTASTPQQRIGSLSRNLPGQTDG